MYGCCYCINVNFSVQMNKVVCGLLWLDDTMSYGLFEYVCLSHKIDMMTQVICVNTNAYDLIQTWIFSLLESFKFFHSQCNYSEISLIKKNL
jgi:hypothetical protein